MKKSSNLYIISAREFKGNYIYAGEVVSNKSSHTSIPGWGTRLNFAKTFVSVKEAKEWFKRHEYNLLQDKGINFNTLGIREIDFKTVKKL